MFTEKFHGSELLCGGELLRCLLEQNHWEWGSLVNLNSRKGERKIESLGCGNKVIGWM